jgi:hypothetical protein
MEKIERRRSPRHADCPPLQVVGLKAIVHDVSRTGVCLVVEDLLETGTRLGLVLQDALNHSRQAFDAEVVWTMSGRAGLRWLNLTPEQDRWMFDRFRAWLAALDGASRR